MVEKLLKLCDLLKSPRLVLSLFVGCCVFLCFPARIIQNVGLEPVPLYRGGSFVLLILSGSVLVTELLYTAGPAIAGWWRLRRAVVRVESSLQTMTPKEREIIAYLLTRNEKGFTYAADAGYASSLVSKGVIVCTRLPGQHCHGWEVPFEVPDRMWHMLLRHKPEFAPPQADGCKPWAIFWANR